MYRVIGRLYRAVTQQIISSDWCASLTAEAAATYIHKRLQLSSADVDWRQTRHCWSHCSRLCHSTREFCRQHKV